MEFGLKGTSQLVADVTGSRHSGLGFTVFWLFTADLQSLDGVTLICISLPSSRRDKFVLYWVTPTDRSS